MAMRIKVWTCIALLALGVALDGQTTIDRMQRLEAVLSSNAAVTGGLFRNTSTGTAASASVLVGNDTAANQLEMRAFSSTFTSANNVTSITGRGAGGMDIVQTGASADMRFYTNSSTLAMTLTAAGKVSIGGGTVLTGTATWDPPSIADGASSSQSVTVTGTDFGDPCFTSHTDSSISFFSVSAVIASADTALVWITNVAGAGAKDLSSGTVRVTCFAY